MKKVITIEATQKFDQNGVRKNKIRVAAYCRVSTANLEQLSSYEAQKEHYSKIITSNPEWELVDIYADEGISATSKEKRNDFLRLISDCELMKIDLILTKSISRFARNTTDCIETVRKLKALGIAIHFEKENINTLSAESELILTILSSLAAEESKSISQNLKWSHQKRAMEGKHYVTEDGSFKRRRNYGEAPQYYIRDHHPGIVSRALFDKAQAVIEQRRKQYGINMNDISKFNNRYVFSNKGFCGECGCRLTRKITGTNHYKKHVSWYCAHYKDGTDCKTTGIVEEKVHAAFIKLFNTLYCNYEQILIPFSRDSKKLLSLTHKNSALEALENRIKELIDEERLLIQLELKGLIDHKMFLEQDEKLVKELEQNRQKFNEISNQILSSNNSARATDELIEILRHKGGIIDGFDDELFDHVVEKFIFYKRSTIGFVLYNGLEFKIKVFKEER